jgi:dihydroorotate dehydrogenase electron transfer subunit
MIKQTFPNTKPTMVKIIEKWEECEDTYGFLLELPFKIKSAKPGQFIMLWVPGVDEYPIGIAGLNENILEIGVAKMGKGTIALIEKKIGEFVGIRGFYGW